MGRGRAKAKQQKVARELKYSSPSTNFSALERELHGSGTLGRFEDRSIPDVDDGDEQPDEDDYGSWASGRH